MTCFELSSSSAPDIPESGISLSLSILYCSRDPKTSFEGNPVDRLTLNDTPIAEGGCLPYAPRSRPDVGSESRLGWGQSPQLGDNYYLLAAGLLIEESKPLMLCAIVRNKETLDSITDIGLYVFVWGRMFPCAFVCLRSPCILMRSYALDMRAYVLVCVPMCLCALVCVSIVRVCIARTHVYLFVCVRMCSHLGCPDPF